MDILIKILWKIDIFQKFFYYIYLGFLLPLKQRIPNENNVSFLRQFFRVRPGCTFLRSSPQSLCSQRCDTFPLLKWSGCGVLIRGYLWMDLNGNTIQFIERAMGLGKLENKVWIRITETFLLLQTFSGKTKSNKVTKNHPQK